MRYYGDEMKIPSSLADKIQFKSEKEFKILTNCYVCNITLTSDKK
jgi:hypothetical protein